MIQIGIDFDGLPVEAMNLREILLKLGFKEEDGKIYIEKDNPIMRSYPALVRNDNMDFEQFTDFVVSVDKNIKKKVVNSIDYEVGEDPKLDIQRVDKKEPINVFKLGMDFPDNFIDDVDE
jgi:hypothetical protein